MFRKVHPREYLKRFLVNDVRPDGRAPATSRRVSLTTGSINTAVGSAMLKIGSTTVVAGVGATLVKPPTSVSDQGILEISVDLLSIASPRYKPGRSDDALVLTEYLRKLIDPHIDLSNLCIEEKELVWNLRLTVYCIDNDGNLEDSVVLASVAAIRDIRLPSVRMNDGTENAGRQQNGDDGKMVDVAKETNEDDSFLAVVSSERTNAIDLDGFPIAVSFSIFEDKALIDPSLEEETVCDSRITFIMRPTGELRSVLKAGGRSIAEDLYNSCLQQAKDRIPNLEKLKVN